MDQHTSAAPATPAATARELPESIEVSTGPEPEFSVIWLHGLGADGHDFEPIIPELRLDPSECCEIDVGTIGTRADTFPQDVEPDTVVAAAAYRDLAELAVPRHYAVTGPPPPPDNPTDLNKLHCTYLK